MQEIFYWILIAGVLTTGGAWMKLRMELQEGGPWTDDERWAARKRSWSEHQRRGLPERTRRIYKMGACLFGVGFVGMFVMMLRG